MHYEALFPCSHIKSINHATWPAEFMVDHEHVSLGVRSDCGGFPFTASENEALTAVLG